MSSTAIANVELLDANNKKVLARKDLPLEIQCVMPSGRIWMTRVVLKAGQNTTSVKIPTRENGIMEIKVKPVNLIGSGTFIMLKSQPAPASSRRISSLSGDPLTTSVKRVARVEGNLRVSGESASGLKLKRQLHRRTSDLSGSSQDRIARVSPQAGTSMRRFGGRVGAGPPPMLAPGVPLLLVFSPPIDPTDTISEAQNDTDVSGDAVAVTTGNAVRTVSLPAVLPGAASSGRSVPEPPGPTPRLFLKANTKDPYLAGGKDSAEIMAFLDADPNTFDSDIRLQFYKSRGNLSPSPLLIPKGQDSGSVMLKSNEVGKVTVEFLNARPANLVVEGDKKLDFDFVPAFKLVFTCPERFSLSDPSEVTVELQDRSGTTLAASERKDVSLAVASGSGTINIEHPEMDMATGKAVVRTQLIPIWPGKVELIATTPGAQPARKLLQVTFPTMLIILSALSALVGGLCAYWVHKEDQKSLSWRLFIGLVAGFIFYWSCVYIGLITVIPRAVIVNPIVAVLLGIIGGWSGTEVFDWVLKALGLKNSKVA